MVFADAGYQGIEKCPDIKAGVRWHVAMRPGKRKALDKSNAADTLLDEAEKLKAGVSAKVEHSFRVIKRQFGYVNVRYRGLKKNTQQLIALFALSNLWMVRGQLMEARAMSAPANRTHAMQRAKTSMRASKTVKLLKFFAKYHHLKINALLLCFAIGCSDHP